MVEAESGSITIDGVDIATLGLRHLRSQMSIIPQVGDIYAIAALLHLHAAGELFIARL